MKVAFVIPWYGNIPGGAESECRETALHLAESGIEVEILTTCVKEFLSDWSKNYYKEGIYHEDGIVVRRFPANKRNTALFDNVNFKLMHNQMVSPEEEEIYLREMINSDKLYSFIAEKSDNYDYFIFIPYMFGTTVYGSRIHPEKSILIPCLHDESYAYMEIFKPLFSNASKIIYQTKDEKKIAHNIFSINGKEFTVGTGVDINIKSDPERFLHKYGINYPFILYAGRRDSGKNVNELIHFFCKYKDDHEDDLKLVLIGKGACSIPENHKKDIIDLGFVSVQDKYDAYGAASLFCLPSFNESFSLVIMEAWLCSTPVLVHGKCAVTKNHCIKSNGGLYYSSYDEFDECLSFIFQNPQVADSMGKNGKNYVIANYSWDKIVSKYLKLFMEN